MVFEPERAPRGLVSAPNFSVCVKRVLVRAQQDKREISQDNEHAARDHMLALYKRDGQVL
jgi:hypothetical protein